MLKNPRILTALLTVALFARASAFSEETAKPLPTLTLIPCQVHRVLDGDTVEATIRFPWGVSLERRIVRLLGFDAFEISKRRRSIEVTDEEIVKGKKAKDALGTLLLNAQAAYLSPGDQEFDRYGRVLARLYLMLSDGKLLDVSAFMKARGHDRGAKP